MNYSRLMPKRLALMLFVAASLVAGCAAKSQYIAGTEIRPTESNEALIERIEEYRTAVEGKDATTLLLMASREYWEDSGTPSGEDDYGFAGLKDVLSSRFQLADSIRYSMRYMRIRYMQETPQTPQLAFVDVLVDASFTIPDARGGVRRTDKRDQGQFVLEWTDDKWMFRSGM